MKKLLFFLLLTGTAAGSFAQPVNNADRAVKTDYLKKSKNQKIIALGLVGGGIVVWLAGASKNMNQNDNVDGGGKVAMAIGGGSVLASIPFFIASSHNKHKAVSLALRTETVPEIHKTSVVYQRIASLTLKMHL